MTTQQEIEALHKRLEELDKQAFLNFVETQEIVSHLKELRLEIPEDKWE